MSLEIWLKKGKTVMVGGRELYMMPLPLTKLFFVGDWLEKNSNDVIKDTIQNTEPGKAPNPLTLVTKVLGKVDISVVALDVFSYPKNPDTKELINKDLTKEFFDEYLDIATAHQMVKMFIELNQLEELLKNLKSLPIIEKLMEAASLAFGIPFLNSLPLNTDSTQKGLEGSLFLKSTGSSEQTTAEKQTLGTTNQENLRVQ